MPPWHHPVVLITSFQNSQPSCFGFFWLGILGIVTHHIYGSLDWESRDKEYIFWKQSLQTQREYMVCKLSVQIVKWIILDSCLQLHITYIWFFYFYFYDNTSQLFSFTSWKGHKTDSSFLITLNNFLKSNSKEGK